MRLRPRNVPQPPANQKSSNTDSKKDSKKDHKCDLCGMKFPHAARLKAHIILVHEKRKTVPITYGNITPNIIDSEKIVAL